MFHDFRRNYKFQERRGEEEKRIKPNSGLLNVSAAYKGDFKNSLTKGEIAIIGEIKRASPSKGVIREKFDLVEIAKTYERVGVDAISVLTEKRFFEGEDSYIPQVKELTTKPVLRKDFVTVSYTHLTLPTIYSV